MQEIVISEFIKSSTEMVAYVRKLEQMVKRQDELLYEAVEQLKENQTQQLVIEQNIPHPFKNYVDIMEKLKVHESFYVAGDVANKMKYSISKVKAMHPDRLFSAHQNLDEDGKPNFTGVRCWRLR